MTEETIILNAKRLLILLIGMGFSEDATKLMISNLINKIQKNIDIHFYISIPEKTSNYLRKTLVKRIDDLKF